MNDTLFSYQFDLITKYKIPKESYSKCDQNAHILVEYGCKLYIGGNETKPVLAEQELFGISGSSMWEVIEEQYNILWSAEKYMKIVGIQCSIMEEEYIKGTKWEYLIDLFKGIDEEIYNLLCDYKNMYI